MKRSRLIVMSIDAMFDEDMKYIKELPNFGRLLKHSARVRGGMRGIYPSLTYPSHVSMITGTYPERHHIFHNEILDPYSREMDWYWYRRQIGVPTILDAAHDAGYTTACLGWPCMGDDPASDWNVPEIWPKRGDSNLEEILSKSASENVLADGGVLRRHMHVYEKLGRFFVDQAVVSCACDLIRTEQPEVIFMHVAHLDHTRHVHGVYGPEICEALMVHDDWLGRILDEVADAGLEEVTNIAVVSDHGHLAADRLFQPNVLLAKAGLIQLDESGAITGWEAYCNSAALSAQVHMREPENREVRDRLEAVLEDVIKNPLYGVEAVFTKTEARREHHLEGDFQYILEGGTGTSFGNGVSGPVIVKPDQSDYKFSVSSHGHLPHKGPQPVFFMSGPDVRPGAVLERQRIIDEAPTFARILGVSMPEAQGRCMEELLRQPQEREERWKR